MEKLLTLDDITLYPAELNTGWKDAQKYDFSIFDISDNTKSLPIFTSPVDSIVSKDNWKEYESRGIKSVLPITEDLNIRLEGCQYIFASFTIPELRQSFLMNKRPSQSQFKICIDTKNNGEDIDILNISKDLKNLYGPQVNIMAGCIGNPKTYIEYCRSGIDYARVGLGYGSMVNPQKFGFAYPTASLLIDIFGIQKTSCTGFKLTKIIADGGIALPSDIIKCIALGADYVMIGRQFARLVEAAGPIYEKSKNSNGEGKFEEILRGSVTNMSPIDLRAHEFVRDYSGMSMYNRDRAFCDSSREWVKVVSNLDTWCKELMEIFSYGFSMAGSIDWKGFKEKIRYGRIS